MTREFKKWCDNLGFFEKKSEISHTLMNGGTLYVPINKHTLFYNKYSELIVKEEISLVERNLLCLLLLIFLEMLLPFHNSTHFFLEQSVD